MSKIGLYAGWCGTLAAVAVAIPLEAALAAEKSPTKQEGEPTADAALVYFMREPRFMARARTMFVYSDDQLAGTLDNDCYTFATLPPGEHLLWLNWAKVNLEVELEPGKTYWYNVFDEIRPIEESFGRALLGGLSGYCTPTDEERRTSAKHVSERFDKAQRVAAKKPADQPDVTAQKRREKNVAKWPRVELAACEVLVVEDFAMADPKAGERKKDYLVESAPARLADQVVQALPAELFAEVLRAPAPPPPGALVLRGSITQYKPGSETARFMVAGAGAAHLEMELELRNTDTDVTLARLPVDRTWAFGGAAGAARGIEEMERNVAYELALYLQRSCPAAAVGGPDTGREPRK
ncbi:MAG TPA: DUF4410 domain-containing protein [Thermoanaerobaculia bacterium]|nr:DUF4410 domain-containing protein [Thermoanaerobaculia bacterium]